MNKFSQLNEKLKLDNPISIEEIITTYPNCKLFDVNNNSKSSPIHWNKIGWEVSCAIYILAGNDFYIFSSDLHGPLCVIYMESNDSRTGDVNLVKYILDRFIIVGMEEIIVFDPDKNRIDKFNI
jgi:hypothetical protein